MKKNRIFKILLILMMSLLIIAPVAFAGASSNPNFELDDFESSSEVPESITNITNNTLGVGISVMRVVGAGIAVITLLVISIKYMIAAPGDRADIKKHAVPFVIGAFVVFGATQILGIIIDFSATISGSAGGES